MQVSTGILGWAFDFLVFLMYTIEAIGGVDDARYQRTTKYGVGDLEISPKEARRPEVGNLYEPVEIPESENLLLEGDLKMWKAAAELYPGGSNVKN